MANEDDIVQKVVIEGDEAISTFGHIGDAGEDAFNRVGKAATAANEPTGAIAAAAQRAGITMDEMRARIEKASQGNQGLAKSATEVTTALDTTMVSAKQTASEIKAAEKETRQLASTARGAGAALQLFARLAHVPEITQLGRAVRLLSRGLQSLAVPVALVFMDRLASSAAEAAREQDKLALSSGLTSGEFGDLASAGTAVGVSNEDFAKSLHAVDQMLKAGAASTARYQQQISALAEKMQEARDRGNDLVQGFDAIRKETNKAADDFRKAFEPPKSDVLKRLDAQTAAIQKFEEANTKANQESLKLSEQITAQDKAAEAAAKAIRTATAEYEANKTALQKLGITELDNNGKLKQSGAVLLEVADKLRALPEGLDKVRVRQELVAAGINSALLPALEKGAAEFQRLQDLGQTIRPPFTAEQITQANAFAIASGQVSDALGSVKDAIGAALQPAFIAFFEKIRDAVIAARPALAEFGNVLAQFVKPILDLVANVITNVLGPALRGLTSIAQQVAAFLNNLFGTDQFNSATVFAIAIVAISAAFGSMLGPIVLLVAAIGALTEQFKGNDAAIVLLLISLGALAAFFGLIPLAIIAIVTAIGIVVAKWDSFKQAAGDAAQAVVTFFSPVKSFFEGLINVLRDVKQAMGGLFGGGARDQIGVATNFGGFAAGGQVNGPGSSTSDSILARLSRGEFVQKAKAVRYYGTNIMHALNNMQIPLGALRGFAQGGLVEMLGSPLMIPSFARGGDVPTRAMMGPSGRPIVLDFGGNDQFSAVVEDNTAHKLGGFAVRRRMASAGKRPSSWGS